MELGYTNTKVNEVHYLEVGDGHTLYIEDCGAKDGIPVVFLHGGPGSSISPDCRRFFDPEVYRIILFDQRGTGKSKPLLRLENNTVFASVSDIEKIREYFGIDKWIVFGGSYGSTLALAYAINHPDRVMHLVLRGIFLGRKEDFNFLYQEGAGYFYPETFETYKTFIPEDERNNLVEAYYKRITSDDQEVRDAACLHWTNWEDSVIMIKQDFKPSTKVEEHHLTTALLESHYFVNGMFWGDDNYILNNAHVLVENNIPTSIFHGRYDVNCRPIGAYELHKKVPHSELNIVDLAGHSPYEKELFTALYNKMEELKTVYSK